MRAELERVVLGLCPEVEAAMQEGSSKALVDQDIRRELIGCLLASQVRHTAAVDWTAAFEQAGLLEDEWWLPRASEKFRQEVVSLLAGEHPASRPMGCYRFFRVRAQQLSMARDAIVARPLRSSLAACRDIYDVRRTLVREIAGLGPKQASLFLRNLGISRELAILDRYVLRFMSLTGLFHEAETYTGRLPQYEAVERSLVDYARRHGFAPGCMDWAIWATMKAAHELGV